MWIWEAESFLTHGISCFQGTTVLWSGSIWYTGHPLMHIQGRRKAFTLIYQKKHFKKHYNLQTHPSLVRLPRGAQRLAALRLRSPYWSSCTNDPYVSKHYGAGGLGVFLHLYCTLETQCAIHPNCCQVLYAVADYNSLSLYCLQAEMWLKLLQQQSFNYVSHHY